MNPLRILDSVSVSAYAVLSGWLGFRIMQSWSLAGSPALLFYCALVLLLSYLIADLLSGVVHFLADNFGNADTPILGPALIHPFREHHDDPAEITRHGFLETNGNNCLVCIPVFLGLHLTYHWFSPEAAILVGTGVNGTLAFIFLTNQVHKWAHQPKPPAGVRMLQRTGLILSPDHHARHHREPFLNHYCITSGWLNPILDRSGILQFLLRIAGKQGRETS